MTEFSNPPRTPRTTIEEGPLSSSRAARVQELAAAAAHADGVAPLAEDVLLHLGHGSGHGSGLPARDLVLTADDATVIGYAHLDPHHDPPGEAADPEEAGDRDMTGELVIHPAFRRQGHGTELVAALLAGAAGHAIRLWAHGDLPAAAELARSAGFTRIRALLQLRMSLAGVPAGTPALPAGVTMRTFKPGTDEESWLRVNRRAFAHHQEQGSRTMRDLLLREAEPWFDPDGFFLAERDGQVAGFHWTKVHQPQGDGGVPIGEVYVVGVDPARQGGGLGRALTLAGLAYLSGLGLAEVMLYVDEDNTAAVKMYTALGFGRWSTDVMYRWEAS